MKHPERVEDYLAHILEAIGRATRYVEPLQGIEAFRRNRQVQDAVVRNIEIIGEAANQIARMAPDFIPQHPELPWRQMRNMRNIVIHGYFNVDLTIVWRTVHEDLPPLSADRGATTLTQIPISAPPPGASQSKLSQQTGLKRVALFC